MKKYKVWEIEHTADFGIKIWASSFKTLFEKGAKIFENLLVDLKNVNLKEKMEFEVEGENKEELFLNLLRELLFIFETKGFIFKKLKIEFKDDNKIFVSGKGEKFSPLKHKRKLNIKAVTYHNFYLRKTKNGFETQVIFDV